MKMINRWSDHCAKIYSMILHHLRSSIDDFQWCHQLMISNDVKSIDNLKWCKSINDRQIDLTSFKIINRSWYDVKSIDDLINDVKSNWWSLNDVKSINEHQLMASFKIINRFGIIQDEMMWHQFDDLKLIWQSIWWSWIDLTSKQLILKSSIDLTSLMIN